MLKQLQVKYSGYTMIEMVLVISIIVTLTTILFANYNTIEKKGEVLRYSNRLKNELQLAQNYTFNYKMYGSYTYGWGLKGDRIKNSFTIFADKDGDKEYSYPVKLLIHGTETNSSGEYYDSSHSKHVFTPYDGANRVNNPGMPDGNGYWKFDGNGDYLVITDNNDFEFSDLDFVIDFWFKFDSGNTFKRTLISKGDSSITSSNSFYCNKVGAVTYYIECGIYDSANSQSVSIDNSSIPSSESLNAGVWYHLAFMRHGQELKLYLHGGDLLNTQIVSKELQSNASIADNGYNITIGAHYDNSLYNNYWSGYIDEIRIVKGMNHWDIDFDTPTENHVADVEKLRTTILAPEIYFSNLQEVALSVPSDLDDLNVYFSRDNLHMYVNNDLNSIPEKDAIFVIKNRADNNIIRSIKITPAGVIDIITP